jgi:type II secretory pathway pseudopilin PulG
MALPRGGSALRGAPSRAAFTLMEVVLVLCLIIVLATVAAISLSGWNREAAFEDGVSHFESALRLARAEAARLGLRLRLAFDPNGGAVILYEPRPLEAPEEFEEYAGCTWGNVLDDCAVRVSQCQLTGSSAYRPVGKNEPGRDSAFASAVPMDSLTFYPDGSSDSALVELKPYDDDDTRRAVIQVTGMDGGISTWMVDADALDDTYARIHREEYPYDTEGG